jgi:protein kinase A
MISEKQIMETISLKKHPFIVNMITSFKDERKLYILLEYVPGGEFFSYLRRVKCFDADAARFYAACVAEVFGYLHAMNVIYRDLKPEVCIGDRKLNIDLSIDSPLQTFFYLLSFHKIESIA